MLDPKQTWKKLSVHSFFYFPSVASFAARKMCVARAKRQMNVRWFLSSICWLTVFDCRVVGSKRKTNGKNYTAFIFCIDGNQSIKLYVHVSTCIESYKIFKDRQYIGRSMLTPFPSLYIRAYLLRNDDTCFRALGLLHCKEFYRSGVPSTGPIFFFLLLSVKCVVRFSCCFIR